MGGDILLRTGQIADAEPCAKICFEAFETVAKEHNFPTDMPTKEITSKIFTFMISQPGYYSVIAEKDGKIIGSNFLDGRDTTAGIGPLSVEPNEQNKGVGRLLMQDAVDHALEKNFQGIRLVTATFHNRAVGLYSKIGFIVREQLSAVHGSPIEKDMPECHVRRAVFADLEECNKVCLLVHGHDRGSELRDSISRGKAVVVGREGRISGYSTGVSYAGHSAAVTNQDLKALISAAPSFGIGFLLPMRNNELLHWCLDNGLRLVRPMTLMSMGPYTEPKGPFLPSILY